MELSGKSIGGVEIVRRLGSGAVGEVYEGIQRSLDRAVALKILSPEHSESEEFVERFLREARIAAKLNHSNIVHVYDAGQSDSGRDEPEGLFYIVMELVPGRSLREVLIEERFVALERAMRWMKQAAAGLGCAHRAGLIHRDVKPGNLILGPGDEIKVADFGLARSDEQASALTQTGTVLGTPSYMSPEQCEGRPADARSDIYSLGATFYHMLAGRPPFAGDSIIQVMYKHVNAPRPALDLDSPAGQAVSAVIQRLMAVNGDERYATAEAVIAELESVEAGHAPSASSSATEATLPVGVGLPTVVRAGAPSGESAGEAEARGDRLAEKGQWAMAVAAYREAAAAGAVRARIDEKVLACELRAKEESYRDLLHVAERLEAAGRLAEARDSYGRALRSAEGAAEQDRVRRKLVEMIAASRSQKTRMIVLTVLKVPLVAVLLVVMYFAGVRVLDAWRRHETEAAALARAEAAAERKRREADSGEGAAVRGAPGGRRLPAEGGAAPPGGGEVGLPGGGPPELPDVAKDPEPPPLGEPPKEPAGGDDPFKKLLSSIVGKGPAEGPKGPNGKAPGGGPAAPGRYGTWTEPLDQLVDLKPLRCSIAVPLSWKEVTDLPPSMNFAMKRQAGDEIPAGLAMRVLHSPRTALDYGKNLERVLMQDTARGYTKAFAYERAIDGRKAYEFSGYYKDRGRQIQCLVTVIKADTLIYEVRLTTLRSEFGDAKEVMRRIAKSFAYRP